MRAILLGLLIILNVPAHADDKSAIVGTWKLVSVVYEDQATKERTPVLGEHPRGRQIATADGRWLALVTAENRRCRRMTSSAPRPADHDLLHRPLPDREDGKVITKVEAAWNRPGSAATDPLHPLRGRPPVHRGPPMPRECEQQSGGGRDLGSGEIEPYHLHLGGTP
jgi:hypothetical protein